MPDTTTVFLCRHADPHNPGGVFYGHLPGFGLGARGRAQAAALGGMLREFDIRMVYTSPLQRARETAAIIRDNLDGAVPEEVSEKLVETAFGRYLQGVPRSQAIFRRPLLLVHLVRPGWLAVDEAVEVMAERVAEVCQDAVARCRGGATVVVSHADPIKAYWNAFLGRPSWRIHGLGVAKGSCLELTFEGDVLVAVTYHPPLSLAGEPGADAA